jgi:protein-disulfide isomerase
MRQWILTAIFLAGMALTQSHAQPSGPGAAQPMSLIPTQPAASTPSAFTPAQRAEIVQILREALRTDPSILRDAVTALQQDELRQQDAATRNAIAAQSAALLQNSADPSLGAAAADVTVVAFLDTRCPYCRRLLPTMAALLKADPKLRLVYKDLPILGPDSMLEARALLAAQRQGGYAQMQDIVMHLSGPATVPGLRADAEALGLQQDMQDPAIQARLDANLQLARALHVEGTPAFVIGTRLIPGAVELADLQDAVAEARTR